MSTPAILKVKGDKIVDGDENPVLLRGAGLGGWMNQVSITRICAISGCKSVYRAFLTFIHRRTSSQVGRLETTCSCEMAIHCTNHMHRISRT
jgi:hypothetical protein